MSEGPRILLSEAVQVLDQIRGLWRCPGLEVVGSVRRELPHVGDIEVIAEIPAMAIRKNPRPQDDPLFVAINTTMHNPWIANAGGGLFEPRMEVCPSEQRPCIGKAVRGLRPDFRACSLEVDPWGKTIPLQVYRYTPINRGWITLMRTGPSEFGQWFLGQWKKRWMIQPDHQASVDGYLVDRTGKVIDTPTETEAFRLCGLEWIPPQNRQRVAEAAMRDKKELMK